MEDLAVAPMLRSTRQCDGAGRGKVQDNEWILVNKLDHLVKDLNIKF